MTDDELLRDFEAGHLPDGSFGHAEHVRLCWVYLTRLGLLETLRTYPPGLLRLATHHGRPENYHETVTWGMIFLVHERIVAAPEVGDWPSFRAANPDLMRWPDSPLFELYGRDVLTDDHARRNFVLPRAS